MKGRLGRHKRAVAAIGLAALLMVVVGFTFLRPNVHLGKTAASTIPTTQSSPWSGSCQATELTLTGIFQECASVDADMNCPTGSFDQVRVLRLHGAKHDFILYVEVKGAYHGPGTYGLAPWPHDTLGTADGVAKVALREWSSGKLWESSAGSLVIADEESGWVYAGLRANPSSSVGDVALSVSGWWSCSAARLPPPRQGSAACHPSAGEILLLKQLRKGQISVTAASASASATLFPKAASVCLIDVGGDAFEAAFFNDATSAMSVRVCASRSGTRFLYAVDGVTVDSATELFWSVSGTFLLWTDSRTLDVSLVQALNAARPRC